MSPNPSSKHVHPLLSAPPTFHSPHGTLQSLTSQTLPLLKNLSLQRLTLSPGAIREPHWTANAAQLAYVLRGSVLVSILDSGSRFANFAARPGQMFTVASGSLLTIENVGDDEAEIIAAFRSERPVQFALQAAFGAMSDAVLGNTYSHPSSAFAQLPRTTKAKTIVARPSTSKPPTIPTTASLPDAHKFDIEAMQAPVSAPDGAGWAKTARSQFWPALSAQALSMYSLLIGDAGMREPHWHPETGELGYVHRGRARMSVLDPEGSVDTYELSPGDAYFVPHAWPHQIECLDPTDVHFLIFFDSDMPQDVGYRASATAVEALLGRSALAATFGVDEGELPEFPFTPADPLVVKRVNPKD